MNHRSRHLTDSPAENVGVNRRSTSLPPQSRMMQTSTTLPLTASQGPSKRQQVRKSLIRRQYSKKSLYRKSFRWWLQGLLLAAILLRFAYHLFWLHTRVLPESLGRGLNLSKHFFEYTKPKERNLDKILEQRQSERQERTKPPPIDVTKTATETWQHTPRQPQGLQLSQQDHDWKSLCQSAQLKDTSRVLITGILSQPPAAAMALLLNQQCGVSRITGADMLFPNLRQARMQRMNIYQQLHRQIFNFKLVVTQNGLARKGGDLDWLQQFQPTHILHFETSLDHYHDIMTESSFQLYTLQQSWTLLQQLLDYQTLQRADQGPKFLHITSNSASPLQATQHSILTTTYASLYNVSTTRLQLPFVYGPLVTNFDWKKQMDDATPLLYVDDAASAILTALQKGNNDGVPSYRVDSTMTIGKLGQNATFEAVDDDHVVQTITWEREQEFPYGESTSPSPDTPPFQVSTQYKETYGVYTTRFPCASQCSSLPSTCTPSAFDAIVSVSQNATQSCKYGLLYTMDFQSTLEHLYVVPNSSAAVELCRVAFVSGKSRLVQRMRSKMTIQSNRTSTMSPKEFDQWNGQLKSNGWTLVWLPEHDESNLSDADYALARIDPSKLFSSSVSKALYVETEDFATAPDEMILRILWQIDRPATQNRKRKEIRPGTDIRRFVPLPDQAARHAALFGGEVSSEEAHPKSILQYTQMAEQELPKKQIAFYTQVAHLVQTNDMRPEDEIRRTIYTSFPFQWMSMSLLAHDFRMEASRRLRCSWYDEYLYWGGNRNAEELSLAYVIGKMRIQGAIGPSLEDDPSWSPFLANKDPYYPERQLDERDGEVFLRVMLRRRKE